MQSHSKPYVPFYLGEQYVYTKALGAGCSFIRMCKQIAMKGKLKGATRRLVRQNCCAASAARANPSASRVRFAIIHNGSAILDHHHILRILRSQRESIGARLTSAALAALSEARPTTASWRSPLWLPSTYRGKIHRELPPTWRERRTRQSETARAGTHYPCCPSFAR